MRVLAVTNMYPTESHPGAGIFVEQQITGLRRVGVDVHVLMIDRLRNGMAAYLRVPRLVKSWVSDCRPDVVHTMYGGVLADLVTSAVRDCPTIVTYHGSDLLGERLSGPLRRLIARYGVYASQRAARRADGLVVVSEVLRDHLEAARLRAPVRVIPCGIDLDRFKRLDKLECRRQLGWSGDRFHVAINTNGGDPVKRVDLARATVARLNQHGVASELHEMQGLRNEQVPVWLNASDALLLTSLREGSPTVVKEALACDVPVVSVDVGDVRQRIHGVEGCYIAAADPEDLASKLRRLATKTARVETRSSVMSLSLEFIALQLLAFYQDVLGQVARLSA